MNFPNEKKGRTTAEKIVELYSEAKLPEGLEAEVRAWLASGFHAREKEQALWELWKRIPDVRERGERRALRRVKRRLGLPAGPERGRSGWLRAAAAAVVLATLAGGYLAFRRSPLPYSEPGLHYALRMEAVASDSAHHLTLPDGTRVRLGKASRLTYREGRRTQLDGEALFNVAHVPGERFSVATDRLTATATGTRFNVMARPGTPETVVSLYEGGLEVAFSDTLVVMTAGEELTLDHATGKVFRSRAVAHLLRNNRHFGLRSGPRR